MFIPHVGILEPPRNTDKIEKTTLKNHPWTHRCSIWSATIGVTPVATFFKGEVRSKEQAVGTKRDRSSQCLGGGGGGVELGYLRLNYERFKNMDISQILEL